MVIETNYDIDSEVYFLVDNKVTQGKIYAIDIYVDSDARHYPKIKYKILHSTYIIPQEKCFASKFLLLKSL